MLLLYYSVVVRLITLGVVAFVIRIRFARAVYRRIRVLSGPAHDDGRGLLRPGRNTVPGRGNVEKSPQTSWTLGRKTRKKKKTNHEGSIRR